ncbi:MAG TPA: polysaccharide deacetylase family protein [Candidatus Binatia bacterium]|jgi:peptidoglycan/xylan/chitin deacetylase (PgdA/CDA1 family)|nr:polysaccharide deacetylase family protein [Candidatus Binatia bacterium]
MLTEHHAQGKIFWPNGARLAVALTFDFQGGEDVKPDKNGKINHEEYTQGEYGPNTGIWRILRILDETKVKATFMTCGGIAERYPEAMAAIAQRGHEVAGHGYHHEVARDLTREEERDVIRRTLEMLKTRSGRRPIGWRSCTQSPNSIELLMEQGYLWNSNSFSHDLPFVWSDGTREIVELPRQPFGDGRTYGHRDSGNPNDALVVWKSFFDDIYEESAITPNFCTFQFHPYISSRFGRATALRQLIQYMKSHEGVWFATGTEVAEWWLKQGFSAKPQARAAAGS